MSQNIYFKISEDVDPTIWNRNLKKSKTSNFFQCYEFIKLRSSNKNRIPVFIQIFEQSEVIGQLALIIRQSAKAYSSDFMETIVKQFSNLGRRGVWVGGPIIHSDKLEQQFLILEQILSALETISKNYKLSIIDGYSPIMESILEKKYLTKFSEFGYTHEKFFTFLINLENDLDKLWKNIQKNMRGDVTRANRRGMVIKELNEFSQVDDFLQMAQQWGKTKGISKSVNDENYKKELWNCIQGRKLKIFLAYENNFLMASHSLGIFNKNILYFEIRNSYSKSANLAGPSLAWYTIEWSKKQGFLEYDFSGGKSLPIGCSPSELYSYNKQWSSLINYKKKWGGKEMPYYHFIKVRNKKFYKLFRLITIPDNLIRNFKKTRYKKDFKISLKKNGS